jgi:hypothetical protein
VNNIQKAFQMKSKLRKMADGGAVRPTPEMLGDGLANRAGNIFQNRGRSIDAAVDAAAGGTPAPAPAAGSGGSGNKMKATSAPAKEEPSALRRFFGLADGGSVFKTAPSAYTDQMGREADRYAAARPGNGTLSFSGSANALPPPAPLVTAPSGGSVPRPAPPPVQTTATPPVTAPAASASPVSFAPAAVGGMDIFSPQEKENFRMMGVAGQEQAKSATDLGVQAGQEAAAAARPASPLRRSAPPPSAFDEPVEQELADGGKVKGKGGPTDDKIGPVMLSNGEYVLPADTAAAIGHDKLDALRLATHEFKDPNKKPNVSGLRKMADGGTFYVDPKGDATRTPPRANLPVPAQPLPKPPSLATRAGNALGSLSNTRLAGGALSAAAAVGGAADIAKNGANVENVGDTAANVGLTAASIAPAIGSTVAAPLAGAAGAGWLGGRAISSFIPEETRDLIGGTVNGVVRRTGKVFGQDWGLDEATEMNAMRYNAEQRNALRGGGGSTPVAPVASAPAALDEKRFFKPRPENPTGADPNSAYAAASPDTVVGQFNGRDITKADADRRAASLQSYTGAAVAPPGDPLMEGIQSALRNIGRGGGGGGFTGGESARAINQRYDRLASQLSGMYSSKGQGNLARRMLELEQSRTAALEGRDRNMATMRGQNMSAQNANQQAQLTALGTLGTMAQQRAAMEAKAREEAERAMAGDADARTERSGNLVETASTAGDIFSQGDKEKRAATQELLATLPEPLKEALRGLEPDAQEAAVFDILRAQEGAQEGLVFGRDKTATIQNMALGAGVGNLMARSPGREVAARAIDKGLGAIPRIGKPLSALRPVERLTGLLGMTGLGAAGGALATPVVENYTRFDPVAVNPETGAPLPMNRDIPTALRYGLDEVLLDMTPFGNQVRTESGRLTDKPTPDEMEALRRLRALQNQQAGG